MKRLIIKANYGQEFTHYKLPNLFLKLVIAELSKPINITILTYIRDNYNLSHIQLFALLKTNLRISGYADNVVIDFALAEVAKETLEDGSTSIVYLDTVINFINDGNREVRGSNIINNIITYLQDNIETIFRLSRMRGGSALWR